MTHTTTAVTAVGVAVPTLSGCDEDLSPITKITSAIVARFGVMTEEI